MSDPNEQLNPANFIAVAEQEMSAHELELFERALARLKGLAPASMSLADTGHLIEGLIGVDPALSELVDRLAILSHARLGAH
ncbi:MAG: hypothetical protein H0X42_09605 [Solirubrobacterales bacterium]|nr:hypothetical protein [Solirubrobacterales bacterium]